MKNDHKKGSILEKATKFLAARRRDYPTQIATSQALAKVAGVTLGSARFLTWRWNREGTLAKLVKPKTGKAHKAYVGINITRKTGRKQAKKPKTKRKAKDYTALFKHNAKAEATIPVSLPA